MSERRGGAPAILAIHPDVKLSRSDKAKLARAGVIVISADPASLRAIDLTLLAPQGWALTAALETLNRNWNCAYRKDLQADFGERVIKFLSATSEVPE